MNYINDNKNNRQQQSQLAAWVECQELLKRLEKKLEELYRELTKSPDLRVKIQNDMVIIKNQIKRLESSEEKLINAKSRKAYDTAFFELAEEVQSIQKQERSSQPVSRRKESITPLAKAEEKSISSTSSAFVAAGDLRLFINDLKKQLADYKNKINLINSPKKRLTAIFKRNHKENRRERVDILLKKLGEWENKLGEIVNEMAKGDSAAREAGITNMMQKLLQDGNNTLKSQTKNLKGHFFSGKFTEIIKTAEKNISYIDDKLNKKESLGVKLK